MTTLFIIGNGFDLLHNLKTKYENFKCFLEEKINEKERCKYNETYTLPDGTETINEDFAVEIIYQVLSDSVGGGQDDWSNFEELLGELDFSRINDLAEDVFIKDPLTGEYDLDYSSTEENVLYVFKAARIAFDVWLPKLFREWVLSIEDNLNSEIAKEDVQHQIDSRTDSYFINFNYTSTLGRAYEVNSEKVLHIHGSVAADETLILGHKPLEHDINKYSAREESEQLILKNLEKNTADARQKLECFWENSINCSVDEIIIIGHSLGTVDQEYFKFLFNRSSAEKILINTLPGDFKKLSGRVKKMFTENKEKTPKIEFLEFEGPNENEVPFDECISAKENLSVSVSKCGQFD